MPTCGPASRSTSCDGAAAGERSWSFPGEVLWIDVIVPAGDALWADDVGRASHWLGDVWAAALAERGIEGEVHKGPLVRTPMVRGGVLRRPRPRRGHGAAAGRSSASPSAALAPPLASSARPSAAWDPGALAELLVDVPASELAEVAAGVGIPLDDLLTAFLRHLP